MYLCSLLATLVHFLVLFLLKGLHILQIKLWAELYSVHSFSTTFPSFLYIIPIRCYRNTSIWDRKSYQQFLFELWQTTISDLLFMSSGYPNCPTWPKFKFMNKVHQAAQILNVIKTNEAGSIIPLFCYYSATIY